MNLVRRAQTRFDRPLYRGVRQRRCSPAKWIRPSGSMMSDRETSAGRARTGRTRLPRIHRVHILSADLELGGDLRVDLRHVVQRLSDTVFRGERAPALRVRRPGVAREHDATPGLPAMIGIEHTRMGRSVIVPPPKMPSSSSQKRRRH